MAYFEFQAGERPGATWAPLVDVYESADAIIVRVELPGVLKKDLRLRWRDGLLTISGHKERRSSTEGAGRFLCVERQYGAFRRDVAIRTPIDFQKASARLHDGLLKIRLPKLTRGPLDGYIPIDENHYE